MLNRIAIGRADESLAALTECRAGNDCYVLGLKKLLAEFLRGKPRAFNAGEGVERTLGIAAGKAELVEAVYHYLAS